MTTFLRVDGDVRGEKEKKGSHTVLSLPDATPTRVVVPVLLPILEDQKVTQPLHSVRPHSTGWAPYYSNCKSFTISRIFS